MERIADNGNRTVVKLLIASVCALVVSSGASAATPPYSKLRSLYTYNASAPAGYKDSGVDNQDGIAVHSVSFASSRGGRVTGFLVLPTSNDPAPLILWSPGLGGSRGDQLNDALTLAGDGAASFLIDPPSARPGGRDVFCTIRDRAAYVQQVVDLRQAIDVIGSLPEIDSSRVAQVGFSYGSSIAGTLAGVERRITATVIDSGRAYHSNFLRDFCSSSLSKRKLASYLQAVRVVDPVLYVGHVAPRALLFQSGRLDPGTPQPEILALLKAASSPKEVRWYQAGHALNDKAIRDRERWLVARLGLTGVRRA